MSSSRGAFRAEERRGGITTGREGHGRRRDSHHLGRVASDGGRIQLYLVADVAETLGRGVGPLGCAESDTEHSRRLEAILNGGASASWRSLASPEPSRVAALDELDERAPHFAEVTNLVRLTFRAAIAMGLPTSLPPMLLLGDPGFGQSWYVGRLAAAVGLRVCLQSMAGATLADGLLGSHPVWRNARPGLVAHSLLQGTEANPLILVDEFDKPMSPNREDPYRAFYILLEPESSTTMIDEYLGFSMDASHVNWILAGNSAGEIPAAIVDRLTIITVPPPSDAQRRSVAVSVFSDLNEAKGAYFDPITTSDAAVDRLSSMTARVMRRVLGEAVIRAAADGRRTVRPDDVVEGPRSTPQRAGFMLWP